MHPKEQIAAQIDGLQKTSGNVSNALAAIRNAVEIVQSSVSGVAAAIEEQSTVTKEITGNMRTASTAVQNIDAGMGGIMTSATAANGHALAGRAAYDLLMKS